MQSVYPLKLWALTLHTVYLSGNLFISHFFVCKSNKRQFLCRSAFGNSNTKCCSPSWWPSNIKDRIYQKNLVLFLSPNSPFILRQLSTAFVTWLSHIYVLNTDSACNYVLYHVRKRREKYSQAHRALQFTYFSHTSYIPQFGLGKTFSYFTVKEGCLSRKTIYHGTHFTFRWIHNG